MTDSNLEPVKEENIVECRACLQEINSDSTYYNLFDCVGQQEQMGSTIAEKLSNIAHIEISDADELPKVICDMCCTLLQSAHSFAVTVRKTDELLRQKFANVQKESEIVWPKPIQISNNIDTHYIPHAEIKEEVLSEDECFAKQDSDEHNISKVEIKVESNSQDRELNIPIDNVKTMEEEKLKCTICKQSHGKLILYTDNTIKKCKQFLKQRVIHNLKYKDIKLPEDLYGNGYHRECYKSFTALPKKYLFATPEYPISAKKIHVLSNSENTSLALTPQQPSNLSINDDSCAQSTSSEQNNFTALESDIVSNSSPASTRPEPIVISEVYPSKESIDELESVEPVSYITEEPSATFECYSNSFTHSDSFERDMTTAKTQTCIYCDQKTKRCKLKRLPLHACNKSLFLTKLNKEEKMGELIQKVQEVTDPTIYYHTNCKLKYSYKISVKKNTVKTSKRELRKHHQSVFDGNITNDDEDDDSNGQYCDWMNDENSNDFVDD